MQVGEGPVYGSCETIKSSMCGYILLLLVSSWPYASNKSDGCPSIVVLYRDSQMACCKPLSSDVQTWYSITTCMSFGAQSEAQYKTYMYL